MKKGEAGKWTVFAYGAPGHATLAGLPITGDAANISAQLSQDGGALAGIADAAPVELGGGMYVFDISTSESDAYQLTLVATSGTQDVLVIGVPGAMYTRPKNFDLLGIAADGDVLQVDVCEMNSDMRGTDAALLASSAPANWSSLGINGAGHIQEVVDITNSVSANTVAWQGVPVTHSSGPDVNVAWVSGDQSAADNLESDYDGTGYTKANSVIGTCTANTDMRGTNDALLASSAPVNFGALAITAGGAVTVGTNNDKDDYTIAGSKATLDALNDISVNDVYGQVDQYFDVDTSIVPGQETPPTNFTLKYFMRLLYKYTVHPSDQNDTVFRLYNLAGSVVQQKATAADDGTTASKGALVSGP